MLREVRYEDTEEDETGIYVSCVQAQRTVVPTWIELG